MERTLTGQVPLNMRAKQKWSLSQYNVSMYGGSCMGDLERTWFTEKCSNQDPSALLASASIFGTLAKVTDIPQTVRIKGHSFLASGIGIDIGIGTSTGANIG